MAGWQHFFQDRTKTWHTNLPVFMPLLNSQTRGEEGTCCFLDLGKGLPKVLHPLHAGSTGLVLVLQLILYTRTSNQLLQLVCLYLKAFPTHGQAVNQRIGIVLVHQFILCIRTSKEPMHRRYPHASIHVEGTLNRLTTLLASLWPH